MKPAAYFQVRAVSVINTASINVCIHFAEEMKTRPSRAVGMQARQGREVREREREREERERKKREKERERSRFAFAPWEWRQVKAEKSCLLHDSTRRSFGRQARLPAESSCVSIGTFVLAAASVFVLLYACLCTNFVASRTPLQDCARQLASTSPAYVSMRQHSSACVSIGG